MAEVLLMSACPASVPAYCIGHRLGRPIAIPQGLQTQPDQRASPPATGHSISAYPRLSSFLKISIPTLFVTVTVNNPKAQPAMFAARTLRPLRAVARRAYATAAAARPHSGPLHKPPTPPSGGQQLALVGAAGAALFAAGYTVSELRKKNVIVTEKEDEEIEEAVDEVVEEAVEEAEEAEPRECVCAEGETGGTGVRRPEYAPGR